MAFGIDDVIGGVLGIVNKFIPDPAAQAAAEAQLRAQLLQWDQAQAGVDQAEAGNSNVFVSGWRPMIGWVCALALAYQYIGLPVLALAASVVGHPIPKPPITLDDNLWQLLLGMLGMGGLRTYEKLKGVAK